MGKAQIDRDPARFLFRQTIGIGAGQRLDQRTLAVIDVTGGGDDEVLTVGHGDNDGAYVVDAARMAAITSRSWRGKIVRKSSFSVPRAT